MTTFINGENTLEMPSPEFGYEVEITQALKWGTTSDGQYVAWDNSYSQSNKRIYDKRVLKNLSFIVDYSKQNEAHSFFSSAIKGRCENITLRLDSIRKGFFPFGPDLGDTGDFVCRIINVEQGGLRLSPFRRFGTNLEIVLVSAPAYSIPSKLSEGSFTFGTIDGLQYPQGAFDLNVIRNNRTDLTQTGAPYSIDGDSSADNWEMNFSMELHPINASRLFDYVTSTVRANDFTIQTPANYYMFGAQKGSSGTYTCKQLTNPINVKHESYYRMTTNFHLWMKAAA